MEAVISNVSILLSALQSVDIDKDKKHFELKCSLSRNGMKLMGHTKPYDVSCVCLLSSGIFRDFRCFPEKGEETTETAETAEPTGAAGAAACLGNSKHTIYANSQNEEINTSRNNLRNSQNSPQYSSNKFNNKNNENNNNNRNVNKNTNSTADAPVADNDDDKIYKFCIPRLSFHDAIKDQHSSIIKLRFDQDNRTLIIEGTGECDVLKL